MDHNTKSRLLLVDDNDDILQLVSELLTKEGYHCATAKSGEEMFARLSQFQPELILLDVMLPGQDGFELCRQLRADPEMPPVIILSAKDEEIDRVVGLELGADDYIVKPFGRRELVARVKTVLRRVNQHYHHRAQGVYCFGGWRFKPTRMELIDADFTVIPLSSSECDLLLAFVQNPQIPLSRDRLLGLTKGRNSTAFDRSVDSHVSRLRRKLRDNAKHPEIIKTAWGAGYLFTYAVEVV
ncbi:response regulator transcription factor [Spongiibacter taiwanensis]|uniref:response regulator transcription factor n=1 Tax=Spongiibacter taiwanensis TaxID=1748242 RepID=UPI002034C299|nr:response regulator transcription factor [Spongiibacter taiwanensis]USA43982.1 response regulator transcription factor [Spongiibacter taiwanensis]